MFSIRPTCEIPCRPWMLSVDLALAVDWMIGLCHGMILWQGLFNIKVVCIWNLEWNIWYLEWSIWYLKWPESSLILVRFGDFQRLLLLSWDRQMKWPEKSFAIFTFTFHIYVQQRCNYFLLDLGDKTNVWWPPCLVLVVMMMTKVVLGLRWSFLCPSWNACQGFPGSKAIGILLPRHLHHILLIPTNSTITTTVTTTLS